jgi:uncharacterized protein (DUF4213/DUF364 family)
VILREAIDFLQHELSNVPLLEEIVVNPNFTGVMLNNGEMGLAMNCRKGGTAISSQLAGFLGQQIGRNGLEAAEALSNSADILQNSIQVALINALSNPFMQEDYLSSHGFEVERGGQKYSAGLINEDESVGIVGFGGQVHNLAQKAKRVVVSELEPELFKSTIINSKGLEEGPSRAEIIQADEAGDYFQMMDTILLTGCTLVTNTMEEVLKQCQGRRVIVYGCSAAFYPEPLLKRGVDILSTRQVTDPLLMLDLLKNCAGMVERFFPAASEELLIKKQ